MTTMRQRGTVRRLVRDKGFGFLHAEGSDEDLFFHRSTVRNGTFEALTEGSAVTFEVGDGPKGPRAEAVEPE